MIEFDAEYFSPRAVLKCGQIFRYTEEKDGWFVVSGERACRLLSKEGKTLIDCEDSDEDYFVRYFDLDRDYAEIERKAESFEIPVVTAAARACRGLRLLNQDPSEMIFSFMISQNNRIPRIRSIIEKLCVALGEPRETKGTRYWTFPSANAIAAQDEAFFQSLGAGYRSAYLVKTARAIVEQGMPDPKMGSVAERLRAFHGVGEKVANCIALFGFGVRDAFPVDTWLEKVYREDFGGTERDRTKITAYFCRLFGDYAGYIQQFLFYYKRSHPQNGG